MSLLNSVQLPTVYINNNVHNYTRSILHSSEGFRGVRFFGTSVRHSFDCFFDNRNVADDLFFNLLLGDLSEKQHNSKTHSFKTTKTTTFIAMSNNKT